MPPAHALKWLRPASLLAVIAAYGCAPIAAISVPGRDGEPETDDTAALPDADGDGYPGTLDGTDCDDADPSIHPGAAEVCDGRDNDCDGVVDNGTEVDRFGWVDADGDGHAGTWARTCATGDSTDCDDADPQVYQGAEENPCNARDDDCDGEADPGYTAVIGPAGFWSIQDAIDASVDDDVVYICPGTWYGMLVVPAWRRLTLRSWSGDRADTILDGGGVGPIVLADVRGSLSLSALTITHGAAVWLGSIVGQLDGQHNSGTAVISLAGDLSIEDCSVVDNPLDGANGAIWTVTSIHGQVDPTQTITIVDSEVAGNSGEGTSALSVSDTPDRLPSDVTVTIVRSTFSGNLASHNVPIRFNTPSPITATIEASKFVENQGGTIFLYSGFFNSTSTFTFVNTEFSDNDYERAVFGFGSSMTDGVATFTDSRLVRNVGNSPVYGAEGARTKLVSENTDWGSGADLNDPPYNVFIRGKTYFAEGVQSFTCTERSCPLPTP